MQRLPERMLPELRAKWMRLVGAKAVADQGVAMVQSLEQDYQGSINTALMALGMDADGHYRLNLETGEIEAVEAPAGNGVAATAT
jgi:hypothetical protein